MVVEERLAWVMAFKQLFSSGSQSSSPLHLRHVAFSETGNYIAAGGRTGVVFFDGTNGKVVAKFRSDHGQVSTLLAFRWFEGGEGDAAIAGFSNGCIMEYTFTDHSVWISCSLLSVMANIGSCRAGRISLIQTFRASPLSDQISLPAI